MILILGDCHFKDKEPYLSSLIKLFEFLLEKYPNSILIQTGDFLDSARVHNEKVINKCLELLLKFKEVHIITGNHEINNNIGNPLSFFPHHNNIYTYFNPTIKEIDNKKFLFLPYIIPIKEMKKYETDFNLEEFDYVITHSAYPGSNYNSLDELNLDTIKCKKVIYGHIHDFKIHNEKHIQIGVPHTTRFGEHTFDKKCVLINEDEFKIETLPQFFTFEEILYGEIPKSDKNILYIKDAPSFSAIYEKYSNYIIHGNKCNILRNELEINIDYQKLSGNLNSNLLNQFNEFTKKFPLKIELQETITKYLSEEN